MWDFTGLQSLVSVLNRESWQNLEPKSIALGECRSADFADFNKNYIKVSAV